MKILVVGAAGQVGRSLAVQAIGAGDSVLATYKAREPKVAGAFSVPLDKTDVRQCERVIQDFRPDVVIDTGALHNVDYCESHPAEALRVNRDGTRYLSEASHHVDAMFGYISTDFVFDGRKSAPYTEEDPPNPESIYAQSKLAGELATLERPDRNFVVRPSVIYSWLDSRLRAESSSGKGMNFGTWLVEEVGHGRAVRIISDQIASPTLAEDLAGAVLALSRGGASGVFHAAGATAISRYDFSVALVRRLGLDDSLVTAVRTSDLNQKARRPENSSLNSTKLANVRHYRTLALPDALDRFQAAAAQDPGAPVPRT